MYLTTYITVFFACIIELSTAQAGPFGSLGQSGEMGTFEGLGHFGENGPLAGFLPFIGFGPFGVFGGYGISGQHAAGRQGGSESATESAGEPAIEPTETSGFRQPSLMDINLMLMWNQLLGNQAYMSGSGDTFSSAHVSGTSNQHIPHQPEIPVSGTSVSQSNTQNSARNPGQNSYNTDMSWIPYFMLQN